MTKNISKFMMKQLIAAILIFLMLASGAQAAITGATVVTGTGSSDRTLISTNGTFNISFTESAMTEYTNISFPAGFATDSFVVANMTNNTGAATTAIASGRWVNISYTAKAAGLIYFAITSNVKSNSTAGNYNINVSGNYTNLSTTAPTSIPLYVRNPAYPFLVKSNNSVFTVGTETFATGTTTIPLTGKGSANLTLYAPNNTATNLSGGWKATNSEILKATYTSGTTPNNTIYIHVDSAITNPTVVMTAMESSNVPAALVAGGVISIVVVIYAIRRRNR